MPIDPRQLRPSILTRMLNSTPLGEVISERQLRRHRNRAGFRIGDDKYVDLFRYAAWLVLLRHTPQPQKSAADYEAHKDATRARNMELSALGRDIGEIPEVVSRERKEKAENNFRFFCEAYFPKTFHLAWSADHLKVMDKIEQAVLHGGLFALAMPRAAGKALALDTPLPTPTGWTTMGQVGQGDMLFDERGCPCRVTFVTEVQYNRPCYRMTFSDGETIVCDADHLWTVYDRYARINPVTLPTQSMIGRYVLPDSRNRRAHRYRIPLAAPLELSNVELPIEPYALGVWLGDGACANGTVTLNGDDAQELENYLQASGEPLSWRDDHNKGNCRTAVLTRTHSVKTSFQGRLRKLGLLHDKHIPAAYLRASFNQRLALLQGLMDTDGYVDKVGRCEILMKYPRLAETFCELLVTLGTGYGRGQKWVMLDGQKYGPYTRICFVVHKDMPAVRLARKLTRLRPKPKTMPLSDNRQIVDIEPVKSVPVRCLQVDSPSSLYLAGRRMVPTHNTSIAECACLWAVLHGHREFVCLIGSDEGHALDMLDSLKTELDGNELLLEDFPEAVYPITCLDGIAHRANGQLYQGQRTHIGWTAREIVLPTIPDSKASGAIIKVAGITGRIRGMKFKRPDGKTVRPSLVVLDDPQTDESARSPSQCANRESILAGAVLGLAGPGKKISGIMPCTVIRPNDMADRILDRDKHPQWQGERTKMVYSFPKNQKLWDQYAQILADGLRNDRGIEAATEFYRANREAMDEGSKVAWPQRFNYDEDSAIQHAMNLRLQDEAAFFAEYQNDPLSEKVEGDDMPTPDQIAAKTNNYQRRQVPITAGRLTMFIDVQQKLLFYVVAAWQDDFTGYVIDYGAYPDQKRPYFTLRDVRRTLSSVQPGTGLEGSVYAGLESLTEECLGRGWQREDGAYLKIERCLVDANWGQSTDVVYQFCRQSSHAAVLMPSHGRFVGASSIPFSDYRRKLGDRVGLNWRIPNVSGRRAVRHVVFDANYWKSFVFARLAVAMGDKGCLSLFGNKAEQHRLFAEHLSAEYRVQTQGRGRTVDEWKIRPEQFDNHWLDCLVGCAVAASMQGVILPGTDLKAAPKRERIRLSDIQRRKR